MEDLESQNTGASLQSEAPALFWAGWGVGDRNSGIARYARCLAKAGEPLGLDPKLIVPEGSGTPVDEASLLTVPQARWLPRLYESKLLWPMRAYQLAEGIARHFAWTKPAIFHGLGNIDLPPFGIDRRRFRSVVTIHDLIPLLAPGSTSWTYRAQFRFLLPRLVKAADRIVCVSDWTHRTLVERYPTAEGKCTVIPNGVAMDRPIVPPRVGEADNGGNQREILSVSRFEPYKNFPLLVEVFRKLSHDILLHLVTDFRGRQWIQRFAGDLVEAGRLQVHTSVSDEALETLYRSSGAFVHTSSFEGFCLPAAEALVRGLPVVYQCGSGIDEVAGGTVSFPMKKNCTVNDWTDAITEAITYRQKPQFASYLSSHLERLTTWRDSAAALQTLYNELLENS